MDSQSERALVPTINYARVRWSQTYDFQTWWRADHVR